MKGKERKGKERKSNTPYPQGGQEPDGFAPNARQLALNRIFNRRESTRWSADEQKAMLAAGLNSIPEEQFAVDVEAVVDFYQAQIPENEPWARKFWRRTELIRVLRHWPGELDRALAWKSWQEKKSADRGEGRL